MLASDVIVKLAKEEIMVEGKIETVICIYWVTNSVEHCLLGNRPIVVVIFSSTPSIIKLEYIQFVQLDDYLVKVSCGSSMRLHNHTFVCPITHSLSYICLPTHSCGAMTSVPNSCNGSPSLDHESRYWTPPSFEVLP